ncbi:NADH-quinone oxidoreductase subunit NuoG [Buchnera aphidicola]|jgi:NADH-quinone oxidoreductase subunit G|uniref:NADH-quinone oxidoreductase subunit G n=1 Tax=Buchnera aphidicola subsp. Schizaphis graminum (strain Sg) TaxID=198804 RepID=NUOG_BUCAP|nr:NADH-quinone oxidoreductase subunit NuoG [Buchnera aphidicola]Q8K9Y2.1 RecName: Full=NADH-quinone oxidoreductase subunit G; AltName: Full=NADH dehydrogenase I subunit G; AltName: Full=NDH-1 subunit G [Buchnera aphidicola str. Sg (Schizaphis graminum)]AAM67720.1 NADH dehydrogenase I chain G [Buchnera aphidicola str. Sg (Schizaphis graminum)]AWI49784.1 NADH-quinone oxidoreductase subunit G [Buchnera aphidicola (Schizaphis graminum)]
MAKIYVDGKAYCMSESDNLLQACLSSGLNIPYFCWHPILGSLGACRQCAVTQYNSSLDNQGKLIMSCMTPVIDGTIISINDDTSKKFRSNIVELLLTNHPHDCPVCEEGGNCHLQDMTVMTTHNFRNYRFSKRTHKNQYLGSFIKHEMNRCIGCYRCVRYYRDYADGTDLDVYGANNNIYFGRIEHGVLENEHSGNLIEICPTGVFTDKTHSKKYNRKWDMQYAPGICQNCSIGCNISIGERYGEIRRIENRYHESINHYLICDLGRFGYSHTNLKNRPKKPILSTKENDVNILNFNKAIEYATNFFQRYKNVIGVGSIRSSIENNFALQELVGKENFCNGMSDKENSCIKLILDTLKNNQLYIPSLKEIESYDTILILGEDLTQTAPRIALAVRQAMKNKAKDLAELYGIPKWNAAPISQISEIYKNYLYIFNTHETKLDNIADWSYFSSIDNQVRFARAIAYELDKNLPDISFLDSNLRKKASLIAKKIISSKKVLIISGSHVYSKSIIQASINIAISINQKNINHVGLTFVTSSSNTLGLGILGGFSIENALKKLKNREAEAIIFMEYDLYRYISKHDCDVLFKKNDNIMSIDHQYTQTYKNSGFALPSVNFTESSGTIVNFEGRAQRFFQVYDPMFYDKKNCLYVSWKWLSFIKSKIEKKEISWINLDNIISEYSDKYPIFKKIKTAGPNASFRVHGQKIARSPHRSSGRTALRANINIHEPSQPKDADTMFSFSMEGYSQPNKSISHIPFAWFPGWNSPQAWNKFQKEIGRQLISGDSGVHLFKSNKKILDIYFHFSPKKFIKEKYWYVIPYYHIFGNEELTQYSSIIKQNIPLEYVLISELDGLELGLKKNSIVEFNCLNQDFRLPIRLSKHLTSKHIGLPIGRKGFPISLIGEKVKSLWEVMS